MRKGFTGQARAPRRVRKRCDKCGATAMVLPRVRICWRKRPGFSIYRCGGNMLAAPIERAPKPPKSRRMVLELEIAKRRKMLAGALRRQKLATRAVTKHGAAVARLFKQIENLPMTIAPTRQYFDEAQP